MDYRDKFFCQDAMQYIILLVCFIKYNAFQKYVVYNLQILDPEKLVWFKLTMKTFSKYEKWKLEIKF